jgi:hypothetical protein
MGRAIRIRPDDTVWIDLGAKHWRGVIKAVEH